MGKLTESQEFFLSQIETVWRRDWWRRLFLAAREENQYLQIPAGVDAMRAFNDALHSLKEDVTAIKELSTKSGGVLRSLASIFKFGSDEMEHHYPRTKRK